MKRIFVVLALVTAIAACKKKADDTPKPMVTKPNPVPNPHPTPRNVAYRIDCADCQVIYYKADGSEGVEHNVNSSWSYAFEGRKDSTVLLFAYNTSGAPAAVTAVILLNDDTLQFHKRFCPVSGYAFVVDTLE